MSAVAASLDRPLVVGALRGHRAPVAAVSWAFDEGLLASADADGLLTLNPGHFRRLGAQVEALVMVPQP